MRRRPHAKEIAMNPNDRLNQALVKSFWIFLGLGAAVTLLVIFGRV